MVTAGISHVRVVSNTWTFATLFLMAMGAMPLGCREPAGLSSPNNDNTDATDDDDSASDGKGPNPYSTTILHGPLNGDDSTAFDDDSSPPADDDVTPVRDDDTTSGVDDDSSPHSDDDCSPLPDDDTTVAPDDDTLPLLDSDGDGFMSDADCDDTAPAVHPGAPEVCGNGVDDDCDGGPGDCGPPRGHLSLWDSDMTFSGVYVGLSSAIIGDHNGDDAPDLGLCTQVGIDGTAARAYVMDGPAPMEGEWTSTTYADTGYTVGWSGDINGDGLDDQLVGAYEDDLGGHVALYYGPLSGIRDSADADGRLVEEDPGGTPGTCLSGVGDRNGDGVGDIILGDVSHSEDDPEGHHHYGAIYVVDGPVAGEHRLGDIGTKLLGELDYYYTGNICAAAGDTNGDGLGEFLVGAVSVEHGRAYLVAGEIESGASMDIATATFSGDELYDNLGAAVGAAGDVNHDGYGDVWISAPWYGTDTDCDGTWDSASAVFLFLGPLVGNYTPADAAAAVIGTVYDPSDPTGSWDMGWSLVGNFDANGDGELDLLIGDPNNPETAENAGAAWLMYGPFSGTTDVTHAHAKYLGVIAEAHAGIALMAPAGDLNGDGYDDFGIGQPYLPGGLGLLHLFWGGPGL